MAIDNRIVASNISKLRNNRGMTQFQLAAALNVSHQAVSKWETGAALPDIQTLLSLTQLFGVTMEELLNTEIVIREEEAPEEEAQEESADTLFGGFLNDLIPEEAKKALKNAAGEAKKTFIEMSGSLSSRAEKTFSKAVEFAEKAKNDIESRINSAKEASAEPEKAKSESEKTAPKANISFENLSRMAPFMSREKLSELVLRYAQDADLENIVQIAPFLSRATVQTLIENCTNKKADNQIIRRLAPFAGADALYELILNNLDEFDWKTLESLAPFLRRPMVDALAEYAITGIKPEKPVSDSESQSAKETIRDAFQDMMGEIGSMVNEIGNAARSIFTPRQETPAEPEKSEESEVPHAPEESEESDFFGETEVPAQPVTEENVQAEPCADEAGNDSEADAAEDTQKDALSDAARLALETGNWSFIKEHAGEITDEDLLTRIAVSAVSAVAQTESAAIVMKIAHRLTDEGKQALFGKIADEEAWELAIAIHTTADEENAKTIIEKAAEAEGSSREDACLAIEYYAKIAPKDVLEAITAKAVSEDNWVLLNALADAY